MTRNDDFYGKYVGFVRDASDPDNRGRLRLYVPEVMGAVDDSDHWTDWALPCLPWFATLGVGFALVPDTQTTGWGVWTEFRHGDPRFPIWCGVFPVGSVKPDSTRLELDGNALAQIDGSQVFLGGQVPDVCIAPGPNSFAVVLGGGIDTFTGAPYSVLGSASSIVFAKRS